MCYTAAASIRAWLVNVTTCALLFYFAKGNKQYEALALFFLFVGTMQLYDYIFHTYPPGTKMNLVATKLAMLTNHLIPVVLALLILKYMGQQMPPSSRFILGAYVVVALLYTWQSWQNVEYTRKKGDYVVWDWNKQEYGDVFAALFLVTLMVLLKNNFKRPLSKVSVIISLVSFALAYVMFQRHESTGRFWCYFAVFVPVLYLMLALTNVRLVE